MTEVRDGAWRLVSDDPQRGVQVWWLRLDAKQVVVKTVYYYTEDLLNQNRAQFNVAAPLGKSRGAPMVRAASIPPHIYAEKFMDAVLQKDRRYIKRLLNDSDYAAFRTAPGRV